MTMTTYLLLCLACMCSAATLCAMVYWRTRKTIRPDPRGSLWAAVKHFMR